MTHKDDTIKGFTFIFAPTTMRSDDYINYCCHAMDVLTHICDEQLLIEQLLQDKQSFFHKKEGDVWEMVMWRQSDHLLQHCQTQHWNDAAQWLRQELHRCKDFLPHLTDLFLREPS